MTEQTDGSDKRWTTDSKVAVIAVIAGVIGTAFATGVSTYSASRQNDQTYERTVAESDRAELLKVADEAGANISATGRTIDLLSDTAHLSKERALAKVDALTKASDQLNASCTRLNIRIGGDAALSKQCAMAARAAEDSLSALRFRDFSSDSLDEDLAVVTAAERHFWHEARKRVGIRE